MYINLYEQGYGLHDTVATTVKILEDKFVLCFNNGIYRVNENGKETELTSACELEFTISDIENNIDIISTSNHKSHRIDISTFVTMTKEYGFDIDDEYYSSFSRTFLLSGYIGKNAIQVYLIDVKNVSVKKI